MPRILVLLSLLSGGSASVAAETPPAGAHAMRVIPVGNASLSGPAPETDAHFDELQRLGIRTIISVDGAAPDLVRASARGIRYVHLPIGYDGLSAEEAARIARAIRDLPKPTYVHCFHGKHRGPAAAAVAMICLGEITNDEGLALLRHAGTSPKYVGLWDAVRGAQPLDAAVIDAAPADFPERFEVSGVVSAMVRMDRTFDHLEASQSAGWRPPPNHPDLLPEREATMLAETMDAMVASLKAADVAASQPASIPSGLASAEEPPPTKELLPEGARRSMSSATEYRTLLVETADIARSLAAAISAGDGPAADRHLEALDTSCTGCHRRFRD